MRETFYGPNWTDMNGTRHNLRFLKTRRHGCFRWCIRCARKVEVPAWQFNYDGGIICTRCSPIQL